MDIIIYEFDKINNPQGKWNALNNHFVFQNIEKRKLTSIYHSHDFYEFIIVLRGMCTAFINGKEYELVKDDTVFMSPGDRHSFTGQSEDLHIISFSVKSCEVESACEYNGKRTEECFGFKEHPLIFSEPGAQSVLRLIYNNINDDTLVYEYKFLLSYFIRVLSVKSELGNDDECPAVILNALKEMKKRDRLKVGIPAFVAESGYSRPQLSRLVKKYLHLTLHEYISGQRLETAYNDLIFTSSRPEDIAEELGYKSFSHFSQKFKKTYGITPAELRKQKGVWTI